MSRWECQFSYDTETKHLEVNPLLVGKTFWGVGSAAVEQSRLKANMVAHQDGKFNPRIPQNQNPTVDNL